MAKGKLTGGKTGRAGFEPGAMSRPLTESIESA
jgi:hypothetical protein